MLRNRSRPTNWKEGSHKYYTKVKEPDLGGLFGNGFITIEFPKDFSFREGYAYQLQATYKMIMINPKGQNWYHYKIFSIEDVKFLGGWNITNKNRI
ncbi:MAG: hypothetical protein U5K27_07520 [Desulfotignum sp.]|nr:hypothetical protein [Desulfotignum sp.]